MMLPLMLACSLCLIRLFPNSGGAIWFNRCIVLPLVARLAPLSRQQVIFALLLVFVVVAAAEVLAAAGPFDASLVMLWDVAGYLDAAVFTTLLALQTRIAPALRRLRAGPIRHIARPRGIARRRRVRAARHEQPTANDDDPAPKALAA